MYELQDIGSGAMLATQQVTTLYGNTFVQRGGLGVASYHFESEEECYISYANAPASWRLADGSAPPAKKLFLQPSWVSEARTFRGTIEWDPAFNGDSKWEYEIVFAQDFFGITGGRVVHYGSSRHITTFRPPWADPGSGLSYLRWTPPPASIFQSVYVQGPIYHHAAEGIASYHFDAEDDCYISYSSAPNSWKLDDGSSPPARKPFRSISYDTGTRIFSAAVEWEPTFRGATRWEYRMVFAEDFSCIMDGTFRQLDSEGTTTAEMIFADPSTVAGGVRSPFEMYYVRKPDVLMIPPHL